MLDIMVFDVNVYIVCMMRKWFWFASFVKKRELQTHILEFIFKI